MGNLLRLLSRDEGTCFSPQRYDLFLDFESKFEILTDKAHIINSVIYNLFLLCTQMPSPHLLKWKHFLK